MKGEAISREKMVGWRDRMLESGERRLDGAVTVLTWSQSCAPPYQWLRTSAAQVYRYLAKMEDEGLIRRFQGKESRPQVWEVLPESGAWRDSSESDVVLADRSLGVEYIRMPWTEKEASVKVFRCVDANAGRVESLMRRYADSSFTKSDSRGYWINSSAENADDQVAELVEEDLDRLRNGESVMWSFRLDHGEEQFFFNFEVGLDWLKSVEMEDLADFTTEKMLARH